MRQNAVRSCASWTWLTVPVFAAAVLSLAGCEKLFELVDPMFPTDAEEFSPPAVYSTWWNMTQACSGLTGPIGAVTWFRTSQQLHHYRTGERAGGYWNSLGNRIVLTNELMLDGGAVRHEMLHALIGKAGHPRKQFLGKCAGTVDCEGSCVRDAGPYPPPPETPLHMRGDSLEISIDIEPRNPSLAHDAGFFSMTVLVRNPSTHWVTVPSVYSYHFPNVDSLRTFEFDLRRINGGGMSSGVNRSDWSEWIFAPGETKKHVFDFSTGFDSLLYNFRPGTYIARGGYSDWMSGDSTFVIAP